MITMDQAFCQDRVRCSKSSRNAIIATCGRHCECRWIMGYNCVLAKELESEQHQSSLMYFLWCGIKNVSKQKLKKMLWPQTQHPPVQLRQATILTSPSLIAVIRSGLELCLQYILDTLGRNSYNCTATLVQDSTIDMAQGWGKWPIPQTNIRLGWALIQTQLFIT